jgi:hypothetical protein
MALREKSLTLHERSLTLHEKTLVLHETSLALYANSLALQKMTWPSRTVWKRLTSQDSNFKDEFECNFEALDIAGFKFQGWIWMQFRSAWHRRIQISRMNLNAISKRSTSQDSNFKDEFECNFEALDIAGFKFQGWIWMQFRSAWHLRIQISRMNLNAISKRLTSQDSNFKDEFECNFEALDISGFKFQGWIWMQFRSAWHLRIQISRMNLNAISYLSQTVEITCTSMVLVKNTVPSHISYE